MGGHVVRILALVALVALLAAVVLRRSETEAIHERHALDAHVSDAVTQHPFATPVHSQTSADAVSARVNAPMRAAMFLELSSDVAHACARHVVFFDEALDVLRSALSSSRRRDSRRRIASAVHFLYLFVATVGTRTRALSEPLHDAIDVKRVPTRETMTRRRGRVSLKESFVSTDRAHVVRHFPTRKRTRDTGGARKH